jgi:hypothetical protein
MEISEGDDIRQGLSVIITVNELDDDYWASFEIKLPDEESIDTDEFLVARLGLAMAFDKIGEILADLGIEVDDDDEG